MKMSFFSTRIGLSRKDICYGLCLHLLACARVYSAPGCVYVYPVSSGVFPCAWANMQNGGMGEESTSRPCSKMAFFEKISPPIFTPTNTPNTILQGYVWLYYNRGKPCAFKGFPNWIILHFTRKNTAPLIRILLPLPEETRCVEATADILYMCNTTCGRNET